MLKTGGSINNLPPVIVIKWITFLRIIVLNSNQIVAYGMTKEILEDEKFLNERGLEKP